MNTTAQQTGLPKMLILDHDLAMLTKRQKIGEVRKSPSPVEEVFAVYGPCEQVPEGMLHFETFKDVVAYVKKHKVKSILSDYGVPETGNIYGRMLYDHFKRSSDEVSVVLQSDSKKAQRAGAQDQIKVHDSWTVLANIPQDADPADLFFPNVAPYIEARDYVRKKARAAQSDRTEQPTNLVREAEAIRPNVLVLNLPETAKVKTDKVRLMHLAFDDGRSYYGAPLRFEHEAEDHEVKGLRHYLGLWNPPEPRPSELPDQANEDEMLQAPAMSKNHHHFQGAVIGIHSREEVETVKETIAALKEYHIHRIAVVSSVPLGTSAKLKLRRAGAHAVLDAGECNKAVEAVGGLKSFRAATKSA